MNNGTLNKLIAIHNTLYQLEVSGDQTMPVAKCILALQEVIGEAQMGLMPNDGQEKETEEVNADKMEGITHE